jgi:integrase
VPQSTKNPDVFNRASELGLVNEFQRKDWSIRKSREIRKRKEELEAGGQRRSQTDINAAIDRYLEEKGKEIRARTVEIYGEALQRFRNWVQIANVRLAEHLAPHHLHLLRAYLIGLPKRQSEKGGKRGKRHEGIERRKPPSINRDIRSIRTMLTHWRRRDLTPLLNSDHLIDRLQFVKEARGLKTLLMQDTLALLFAACQRHDAVRYDETRAEHAGLAPVGSTPRYFEITPFVLTVLLTGCRVGEVRKLMWRQVFLEHGYIALDDTEGVKTAMGRRITLDECPLLSLMLAAMKLRAGPTPFVFGGPTELSKEVADNCRARLLRQFDAPKFTWQELRRTCGTFLSCASGIRGAGSAWLSAARLGHGIDVAQKHYLGVLNNIPVEAKTLEAAMGLEDAIKLFLYRRFNVGRDEGGAAKMTVFR